VTIKTAMTEQTREGFEVEAIVAHRKIRGHYRYLLKWKGFPDSTNTWQGAADLHCHGLLERYWEERGQTAPVSHPSPPPVHQFQLDEPRGSWPVFSNIRRILGITHQRKPIVYLLVELESGRKIVLTSDLLRVHYPLMLARFYEKYIMGKLA
jgi:hypothetical protein